jgi:hypothetical protein
MGKGFRGSAHGDLSSNATPFLQPTPATHPRPGHSCVQSIAHEMMEDPCCSAHGNGSPQRRPPSAHGNGSP